MKIKVSAGFSGVISTGSYENTRPSYTAEVELDGNLEEIEGLQKKLQEICYQNFKRDEQAQIVERIEKERKDLRIIDGMPSVTSIIGWDADFFCNQDELVQYAAQGNLIDLQAKNYISTGKWDPIEKIDGSWVNLVIVKKGSLGLATSGWDFPGFLKKFPLEKMEVGRFLKSEKHKFCGTSDIRKCFHNGKKYLCDIKRTMDKVKNGKQCSAYIMLEEEAGEPEYDGFMIIVLNDKTEQGFSKPWIVERSEVKQFQEMFLNDRENFKKRFGI
jgi:hypothetical protein